MAQSHRRRALRFTRAGGFPAGKCQSRDCRNGAGGRITVGTKAPAYQLVGLDCTVVKAASGFFRDILAAGRAAYMVRSYGVNLLRWFRFLDAVRVSWDRASRRALAGLLACMEVVPPGLVAARGWRGGGLPAPRHRGPGREADDFATRDPPQAAPWRVLPCPGTCISPALAGHLANRCGALARHAHDDDGSKRGATQPPQGGTLAA